MLVITNTFVWSDNMTKESTSKKILKASIILFSQKGYNSVSTKEIADLAGVSEMTVFRHFTNKKNLFERAFEKYMFIPKIKSLFSNELTLDVEKDLITISRSYHSMLLKNERLIFMELKDTDLITTSQSPLFKFPAEFKKLLMNYFEETKNRGIIKTDPEITAVNFLSGNFGIFISFSVTKDLYPNVTMEDCILDFVKTFTKGITS